ncbi:hypothetical protein [Hirschia maritima]|uniref:hypothetical protein n=1 Tax=Hirschia maritima TaxID=1121961 RepID=UPI000364C14B|nr:hypothetical protein [Hirschia maritima]
MTDTTRKSDFDDIPLDGFRRESSDSFAKSNKKKKDPLKIKKSDEKKEGFLPSNTPIPFWLDIILFFLWCGAVAVAVLMAYPMADMFFSVSLFLGSAIILLSIRTGIKRIMLGMS